MITDICIQSIQQIKITGRKLWYLNYCNKKDRKQTINTNLKLTVRDKCDSFKNCWGTGTQIFQFVIRNTEYNFRAIARGFAIYPVNAGMERTFYTRLGL